MICPREAAGKGPSWDSQQATQLQSSPFHVEMCL